MRQRKIREGNFPDFIFLERLANAGTVLLYGWKIPNLIFFGGHDDEVV